MINQSFDQSSNSMINDTCKKKYVYRSDDIIPGQNSLKLLLFLSCNEQFNPEKYLSCPDTQKLTDQDFYKKRYNQLFALTIQSGLVI